MAETPNPAKMPGAAAGLDFTKIYQGNSWGSKESRSGPGSTMSQTAYIRSELPVLFTELGIKTLLDAPCGDFNWMQHVIAEPRDSITHYIGGDIVKEMIVSNQNAFGSSSSSNIIEFRVLNLVTSDLPKADLIFIRDCFVHIPLAEVLKAIENIKRSGTTYLLTTTFPEHVTNNDNFILDAWRTVNLERPPFSFPPPLKVINEHCTESLLGETYGDKSLALWAIKDL